MQRGNLILLGASRNKVGIIRHREIELDENSKKTENWLVKGIALKGVVAQRIQEKSRILASLVIAQACLESNFGQRGLAQNGKNLFGVKGAYNGQSITKCQRPNIKMESRSK
ncbi:glucosaminidase domain-containing protein [Thermaerobacillus caldiproteolyticus]|uniref:Putative FlgJ-related protein n=1 Tax=Thermaerobacillus caldiproteolyticus TaxID=247480 RepID=A0A7W0BXL7_9BACL|nr:putative FlgJ-related protein [Anoxybacillus caldiproteolyticus]